MHRGHGVQVGIQGLGGRGVDQDGAGTAGVLHGRALVDPVVAATVADHDLAGRQRRIEPAVRACRRAQQGGVGQVSGAEAALQRRELQRRQLCRGQHAHVLCQHHRGVGQARGLQRRPGEAAAVAQGDSGHEVTVVGGRSHRGQPGAGVGDGVARAGVACRGGHEDAGVGCTEEGNFHGVGVVGLRSADGVVDDVHTVGHGLVDGRDRVGRVATGLVGVDRGPAGLVGSDARPRCHAGDRDGLSVGELAAGAGIATGSGGGVRAVAVTVARGIEFTRDGHGTRAVEACAEEAGADQLVVARRCRKPGPVSQAPRQVRVLPMGW